MEEDKNISNKSINQKYPHLSSQKHYLPNLSSSPYLIDTHAHVYYDHLYTGIEDVLKECEEKGIKEIYMPNVDSESIEKMLELEQKYPDRLFAMIGLHPCSVKENYKDELKLVEEWLDKRSFCAVGEIGIDHHWSRDYDKQQEESFELQLDLALKYELPVSIHSRNSLDVVIEILQRRNKQIEGILHCFTGTIAQAKTLIEMGLYLGIGGVVTFKNSGLDKVVADLNVENLVLETDSPYLAPVPFRGKPNSPAYLNIVAAKIAELKNISIEQVAMITTANAKKIFK